MPPSQIEPTYHTAIWLEDQTGMLVKTLFVSHDLSSTEYKMADVCPDWVHQAHWEKAPAPVVDAVTGPTPNVGSGALAFDVAAFDIPAGAYRFKLQVHISETYNVLYSGRLSVGGAANEAALEMLYSPSKPPGGTDFVRDVRVQYTAGAASGLSSLKKDQIAERGARLARRDERHSTLPRDDQEAAHVW
jgi:hypothetical protein